MDEKKEEINLEEKPSESVLEVPKTPIVDEDVAATSAASLGEDASATPDENGTEGMMRTFTQEQVNELVGKARAEGRQKGMEQAMQEFRDKYGLDDDNQIESLMRDGSRYSELGARYADANGQLKDAFAQIALMKTKILPDRESDVKAILGANGLDVTEDNIQSLLATHPEWISAPTQNATSPTVPGTEGLAASSLDAKPISQPQAVDGTKTGRLGIEPKPAKEVSEKEEAMKLFGI